MNQTDTQFLMRLIDGLKAGRDTGLLVFENRAYDTEQFLARTDLEFAVNARDSAHAMQVPAKGYAIREPADTQYLRSFLKEHGDALGITEDSCALYHIEGQVDSPMELIVPASLIASLETALPNFAAKQGGASKPGTLER